MSSADEDLPRDTARRKFDDIASLFGPIVPPAGSPVRARVPTQDSSLPQVSDAELNRGDRPHLAPPPPLRAPPAEKLPSRPPADPLRAEAPLSITAPIVIPAPVHSPQPSAQPSRVDEAAKPAPVKPAKPRADRSAAESVGASRGARLDRRPAAEAPWPDAFAPRPNYKPSQKSRLLYWLFLIPFAIVVAVAVTLFDPKSIRNFIDQTLPQYLPAEVTQFFARPAPKPGTPEPFPPALAPTAEPESGPQPADAPPSAAPAPAPVVPAPVEAAPPAPSPAADEAPTSPSATGLPPTEPPAAAVPPTMPPAVAAPEAPSPVPAVPASPPPAAQAGADETPAPAAPVSVEPTGPSAANDGSHPIPVPPTPPPVPPVAAAPGATRVTIYYRRNQANSESEARRVAAKLGNAEIRASSNTARSPMIYYFNPADREAATGLARSLAGEGSAGWIVRAGPTRSTAGTIDILLP